MTGSHQDPFATALIAYLPRLRRYATALVGSVSLADDLVQDCMERALRRADTLRDTQRMASWLRSILLHLYMDMVRLQRGRGTGVDLSLVDNDLALSVPPADRGATIDFIRALNGLSVEHRQILLLVGLEGLNYREIAGELGIPMGTVMSRLARARERLRNALEKEENLAPAEQRPSGRSVER
ncbi:MAG TPA: RNA polymerase sigma factor [Micropepsaceae bacterium]|nr:RNA polymerase sigma factor [Micropepsaceae bacterium]